MGHEKSSSGRELVRTVASKQFADVVFDATEVALDENLPEGILKELPVVGSIVKIVRAGQSIAGELFVRKLLRFLKELQGVSRDERERLLQKYPDSSDKQRILGENLLLALERLDDVEKPSVLARFFAAYVKSEIDYISFTRLARALERFNLELLPNLRWFYTREEPIVETPEEIIHELSLAGLVTVGLRGSGTIGGSANYLYSSIGASFLRIGFNVEVQKR